MVLLQDLSGGNSNDSSGGAAPGTPNSQGMRPTPSPTGSTGSRSMSPAVGSYPYTYLFSFFFTLLFTVPLQRYKSRVSLSFDLYFITNTFF